LLGQIVPLQWIQKEYESTNTWGEGLSFSEDTLIRLVNIFMQPLGAKLAELAKANGFCRWSLVLDVLQKLADDCGSSKRSIGARSTTPSGTIVGTFTVWSEQPEEFDAGHVSITVDNTSLTSSDNSALVIQAFSASALIGTANSALSTANLVIPILNSNNVAIGQLVSDGFLPTFTPALDGSFTMCIVKRDDIVAPSCYNTPDFATGVPLQPTDTTFSYQDSDNYCAVFTTAPTEPVYIIMRVNNWATVTSNPCATTTGSHASGASVIVASAMLMFAVLIALLL